LHGGFLLVRVAVTPPTNASALARSYSNLYRARGQLTTGCAGFGEKKRLLRRAFNCVPPKSGERVRMRLAKNPSPRLFGVPQTELATPLPKSRRVAHAKAQSKRGEF